MRESFSSTLALEVKIRGLSQTAHAITRPRGLIIVRGAVESRSVIPDGAVILVPLEAHLRIVILRHEVEQVVQEDVGLILVDPIDPLRESLVDIDALPAAYWIRTNDRVCGPQLGTLVER